MYQRTPTEVKTRASDARSSTGGDTHGSKQERQATMRGVIVFALRIRWPVRSDCPGVLPEIVDDLPGFIGRHIALAPHPICGLACFKRRPVASGELNQIVLGHSTIVHFGDTESNSVGALRLVRTYRGGGPRRR